MMQKYILIVESNGEPAHWTHKNDNWVTTTKPDSFLEVEASSSKAAMNKFVKLLGIEVRYRDGSTGVTDRNLHSYHVVRLNDYLKQGT